ELEAHYMYMAQLQEVFSDAADSGPIFDTEPVQKVSTNDHYNVFAIESEHPEQSKSIHDTYSIEQDEHNVIIDSLDMSYDRKHIDQNDDDADLVNERELLASLIWKLKCEIDDIKNRNKFLETSNKVLIEKLKEKLCAHQETISILSQQKEAQIKLYKTREDNELDKVIALEHKVKVLDNIVYKTENNVSNDFSKPVTAQALPTNKKPCLKNINVLAPGMYKPHTDHTQARTSKLPQDSKKTNKRVLFPTGVIPTTSVSRPKLKSNLQGDRVTHNNSQGKKKEVEDHRRSVKLSKNKTSVTACNDSLNAKTLNVKYVSTMCDKCVLIDKHNMCVLNSVAKPLKETVASESNNKPRNFTRKLYERVSKTCSWWYPKFTPSGYIWKPNSGKENVNPNLIEIVLFIVDSGCSKNMTGNLKLLINFVEKFLGTLIEIVLFIVDSGCSKHMTGNLKLLINFMEKFLGTVKFRIDHIAPILGYGDLVQGAVTIKRVYYVKGLNHNLFFVGQFCYANLEVAFRKLTCYIRDLKGNDLLTEMNDRLLDKTKEDIWKWFYCKPRCTLEEGLTIVENERDIEKMFEVANLQGALDLYVCHIPQVCLVEYYFKNLDFEEIIAWEKEELQSPSYLRLPHVWKSNSVGIGKGKVLLDNFEIVGNGKDKVVLDDAKDGLISTKSDGDQNEGSS
nr:hypothetical protein [Tanacetum cinerariifolium]